MDVKLYSTPTCPYCKMAKDYLYSKNISFQTFDVSADEAALEQMQKVSGQLGVPVIVVGGEPVVGFDKARLNSLLGIT